MEKISRTFRFTGTCGQTAGIAELLRAQGFRFEPLPFHPDAQLLLEEPLPLGSSLAAKFGYIYIQDASSMLPALALAGLMAGDCADGTGPAGGGGELAVLDMCSSPGGKSSLLARALAGNQATGGAAPWEGPDSQGPSGFVLANEPGVKRLSTLRRNLQLMNMLNSGTCSFGGENLPLPSAGREDDEGGFAGWDYILLDPPCSGWGTVEKNPQVLSLWQGDKLKPLVSLQRMLLREAFRLLRPGGCLTYSTCTVNVQENEEQVRWALSGLDAEFGGGAVSLLPLGQYAGFAFEAPWPDGAESGVSVQTSGEGGSAFTNHPGTVTETDCDGVLRVSMDSPLGQGFFIAALRKSVNAAPLENGKKGSAAKKHSAGFAKRGPKPGSRRSAEIAEAGNVFLPFSAIEAPLVDTALLPPGRLALQRGNLVFLPQAGTDRLPSGFAWNGFPLGKSTGEGSRPRVDTGLRALMPSLAEAAARGADVLDVDEPAVVTALLSGQSLPHAARGSEVGLYFRGLPLCRLKARGNRVFF